MTKAFAYARVSTGEQAKGFSLEAQFEEIERFCRSRGIEILDRFSDSMSGTKLKERPALMEMIEKVEGIRPGYVVATESDRISRDTLQFGWINTHLSMNGVRLLLVNEKQAEGPAEKAFQKIRVVFSEFETDLRQWRIDRGRAIARAENRFMNRPPFGYMMRGKEVVPDPNKMEIIKRIFLEFNGGKPIKRISRDIGKSPSAIRYILRNRFYFDMEYNGKHEIFLDYNLFIKTKTLL